MIGFKQFLFENFSIGSKTKEDNQAICEKVGRGRPPKKLYLDGYEIQYENIHHMQNVHQGYYDILRLTAYKNKQLRDKNLTIKKYQASAQIASFDVACKKYPQKVIEFLESDYSKEQIDFSKYNTTEEKQHIPVTWNLFNAQYENKLRGNNGDDYSEKDKKFQAQLNNLIEEYNFPIIGDIAVGKTIEFPTIDKTVTLTEDTRNTILNTLSSDEFKTLFDQTNLNESSNDMDIVEIEEDTDETQTAKWRQKEENIAIALNDMMNTKNAINQSLAVDNVKYYAVTHGGSAKSDIIVVKDKIVFNGNAIKNTNNEVDNIHTIKSPSEKLRNPKDNDEYFFVEAKLDYKSAAYFKFVADIEFDINNNNKIKLVGAPGARRHEISDDLYKKIMAEWETNEKLNSSLKQLRQNLENFVEKLRNVEPLRKRFGNILNFDKKTFNFPSDTDNISTIFNFYVIEWMKKLSTMKQTYIYSKLQNKTNDINHIIDIVTNLKTKIKAMVGGTSGNLDDYLKKILEASFIDKFNYMYSFFTGQRQTSFLDTDYIEDIKDEKNKIKPIYEIIEQYYADEKDVRYIEIGDDLYQCEPTIKETHKGKTKRGLVSSVNPLNLQVRRFNAIANSKHKIKLNFIKVNDKNGITRKLLLKILISDPAGKKNKSFEDMDYDKEKYQTAPFFKDDVKQTTRVK